MEKDIKSSNSNSNSSSKNSSSKNSSSNPNNLYYIESMQVDINELINSFKTNDAIKNILTRTNMLASSDNPMIKNSVRNLFIESPSCNELVEIAECYAVIISQNHVNGNRGYKKLLPLAIPAYGASFSKDFAEFLASPEVVAGRRSFVGTFLISFENWTRAGDFLKNEACNKLFKYINDHKDDMSFIFHVTPEFKDADALFKEIGKIINLSSAEHKVPELEEASDYICRQLETAGIHLEDEEAKIEMNHLIAGKIDFSSTTYDGYESLNRLTADLIYELYKPAEKVSSAKVSSAKVSSDNAPSDNAHSEKDSENSNVSLISRADIVMASETIPALVEAEAIHRIGF